MIISLFHINIQLLTWRDELMLAFIVVSILVFNTYSQRKNEAQHVLEKTSFQKIWGPEIKCNYTGPEPTDFGLI